MKHLLLTLSLIGAAAGPTTALARSVGELDAPINLTARVIDGTVFPEIRLRTTDAKTLEFFESQYERMSNAARHHCRVHRLLLKVSAGECGFNGR